MFDVGFQELILLFVIGLLILGPERLPRVASQLGRWMGKARRTAHQLRMQLEREMTMNDITREKKERERRAAESGAAADTAAGAGTDTAAGAATEQAEEDANDSGHHDAGAEDSGEAPAASPSAAAAPGTSDTAAASDSEEGRQRQA